MKHLSIIFMILSACNFNKERPDEIVSLTDEVLNKHQGVEITIEPVKK